MSTNGHVSENRKDADGRPAGGTAFGCGFSIVWQDGVVATRAGVREPNGAFVEDVMYACLDRLRFYQESEFGCDENAEAIANLVVALNALDARTKRRIAEGVEGTHAK